MQCNANCRRRRLARRCNVQRSIKLTLLIDLPVNETIFALSFMLSLHYTRLNSYVITEYDYSTQRLSPDL